MKWQRQGNSNIFQTEKGEAMLPNPPQHQRQHNFLKGRAGTSER